MAVKREAPITWRPPKPLRDRLEKLATAEGVALSKVIQDLIERGLSISDGGSMPEPKPKKAAAGVRRGGKRTSPCEHRRSPEDFCSRCDA